MKRIILFACLMVCSLVLYAQSATEKQEVLRVVEKFFLFLEVQDSAAFTNLHVKGGTHYILRTQNDSVITSRRNVENFSFAKDRIIKERMRPQGVRTEVHDRVAMVWAPYDLWVNNIYSHCGVDVFTLLKTTEGWKIATCSFTIEKNRCGDVPLPK